MKKSLFILLFIFLAFIAFSQDNADSSKLNLNLERIKDKKPIDWSVFGSKDYISSIDSTVFKSGKYSAMIEYHGESPDYKAWSFIIPGNYAGKEITLKGNVKTENVTDGWAGLWMRIDPNVAFDNMEKKGIKGTTKWRKCKITLKMNAEKTKQIVIGALLVGKGKMWFDDLQVLIDGKDINTLTPLPPKIVSPVVQNINAVKILLPKPSTGGTMSLVETLWKRRSVREYKDTCLTLQEVSQILWAAYGISDSVSWNGYGLHTAPSAGALYPLEIYLVAGNVSSLPAGIYKYYPKGHYLMIIKTGDQRSDLCDAAYQQEMVKYAPASLVYSAVFSRNTDKYGDRGRERYVCMDLGHSGENVYLQATALGIGTCAIGAFTDADISNVVGMPKEEEPLYVMPLGKLLVK